MKEVKETKWVEQTTVKWFSDDGNKFDSEQACREYERSLKGETAKKAYDKFVISKLDFPLQNWDTDYTVDLIKLKSHDDYETMMDYLESERYRVSIDCKEPKNYPCIKVLVMDEYVAEFVYEDIEEMLNQCEKMMTIIEKALIEME